MRSKVWPPRSDILQFGAPAGRSPRRTRRTAGKKARRKKRAPTATRRRLARRRSGASTSGVAPRGRRLTMRRLDHRALPIPTRAPRVPRERPGTGARNPHPPPDAKRRLWRSRHSPTAPWASTGTTTPCTPSGTIAVDTPVVTAIPKAACLSARTCSVAETLRAARLGGGLALNIAIMHERVSRRAGPLGRILRGASRARRAHATDVLDLRPAGAPARHRPAEARHRGRRADRGGFRGARRARAVREPPRRVPAEEAHARDYMEAASLAASRAFFIGDECGEAFVPWADMFNHKTDGEHVHVLGADGRRRGRRGGRGRGGIRKKRKDPKRR